MVQQLRLIVGDVSLGFLDDILNDLLFYLGHFDDGLVECAQVLFLSLFGLLLELDEPHPLVSQLIGLELKLPCYPLVVKEEIKVNFVCVGTMGGSSAIEKSELFFWLGYSVSKGKFCHFIHVEQLSLVEIKHQ